MRAFYPFIIAGLTSGSVYGLAGMGLVLSYKTSGVFNFAHGAVAAAAAFLFSTLHVDHGMAWPAAAAISIGLTAVVGGVLVERIARRLAGAEPAVKILATVGLLLAIQGSIAWIYGPNTRRLPRFLPTHQVAVGDVNVDYSQLIIMVVGAVAAVALLVFFRSTRLGLAMRAVVDDTALVGLHGVNPAHVRLAAWCISCGFAALSGVLIAPTLGLDVFLLTLLVVQAFGAAAIGYFSSLPLTYLGGLAVGILSAVATKYVATFPSLNGLPSSVPFLVLFIALLVTPRARLVEVGTGNKLRRAGAALGGSRKGTAALRLAVTVAVLAIVPHVVGTKLPSYTTALTFVVMFLSLGLLVLTSGQVSLCHAAFAAVGVASFSQFTTQLHLPWALALVLSGLVVVPLGAMVAIPAIRLSPTYLALATFGLGILLQRIGYPASFMFGVGAIRHVPRAGTGWLAGDEGFYYTVLVVAVAAAALVWAVYRSRLGRLLRALPDSPLALTTLGTSVNVTRVLVFCFSAFLAGMAGSLLGSATGATTGSGFGPFESLIWLAVLAVSGTNLFRAAGIAAAALCLAPAYLPNGLAAHQTIIFGSLAIVAAILRGRSGLFRERCAAYARRSDDRRLRSPVAQRQAVPPADIDMIDRPGGGEVVAAAGREPERVR